MGFLKAEKFQNMTRRELAGYIWDYYKPHIIAAAAALFIAGAFVNAVFISPAKKPYISAAVYGTPVGYASVEALQNLLTGGLVPDGLQDGWEAVADNFYTDANPQVSMALTQKFAALLMMGEIDVIIAGRAEFDALLAEGMLMPLDGLLAPHTSPGGGLIPGEPAGGGGQSFYGVEISGSAALAACEIKLDSPAAAIAVSSKRPDTALECIRLLCKSD